MFIDDLGRFVSEDSDSWTLQDLLPVEGNGKSMNKQHISIPTSTFQVGNTTPLARAFYDIVCHNFMGRS